jgi:hypothetical protein
MDRSLGDRLFEGEVVLHMTDRKGWGPKVVQADQRNGSGPLPFLRAHHRGWQQPIIT